MYRNDQTRSSSSQVQDRPDIVYVSEANEGPAKKQGVVTFMRVAAVNGANVDGVAVGFNAIVDACKARPLEIAFENDLAHLAH